MIKPGLNKEQILCQVKRAGFIGRHKFKYSNRIVNKKLRDLKQRNAFMTDVISWPTGTKTTLKEEIKNYDLELSKILAGEE